MRLQLGSDSLLLGEVGDPHRDWDLPDGCEILPP